MAPRYRFAGTGTKLPYAAIVKAFVVSDKEKALRKSHVSLLETTAREPLMKCRKCKDDVKTGGEVITLGLVRDAPVYCPDGIRHKDGVNDSEALVRNVGTYVSGAKGKVQAVALRG